MSNSSNHLLGANLMRQFSRGISEGYPIGGVGESQAMISGDSSHTSTGYCTNEGLSRQSSMDYHSAPTISPPISPMVHQQQPMYHPVYLNGVSPSFPPGNYYYGQPPTAMAGLGGMAPPMPFQYKAEKIEGMANDEEEQRLNSLPMQSDFLQQSFDGNFIKNEAANVGAHPAYYNHQANNTIQNQTFVTSPFHQSQQGSAPPHPSYRAYATPLQSPSHSATFANLDPGMQSNWPR
jgi:hypothetical protein